MAGSHARTRKIVLDQQWRSRIRTSMILNRLQDHIDGKVELSATQVTAATVLLRKTMPDLSATELSGDPNRPVNMGLTVVGVEPQKK